MAVGDVASGKSQVATTAVQTIQPGAGAEWVIHNIYHEAEVELYFCDGTSDILFDTDSAYGAWTGMFFHVTNTHYLKVKNTNAASKYIGYDGIITK